MGGGGVPLYQAPFCSSRIWEFHGAKSTLQCKASGRCSLCLPPSPVGLGSEGEKRHCFSQAGVCINHKVRAVALAYVTDTPPETWKPRCLIPARVPDLLRHTESLHPRGCKTKRMEVILLAVPAQNYQAAIEVKTCCALGQATRGNSELEKIEFL